MRPFESVSCVVAPLERADVDTDQIVPKQFLKLIRKTGFGEFLFYNWRYDSDGNPNAHFVLNDPQYRDSHILAAGANFGCGSSREHAVWALLDYGFTVIVAPSFADIFYGNCFKNGILPIVMQKSDIARIAGREATVDLQGQKVQSGSESIPFEIDSHNKRVLLEGLDDISLTFEYEDAISEFERRSGVPSAV